MKRIFKLYLLLFLLFASIYAQNILPYMGNFPSASIVVKKNVYAISINYTNSYSFNQNTDINHYKRLSMTIPLASDFEIAFASTLGEGDNKSKMIGFNYNFKKKKFGIATHIASYHILFDNMISYTPLEYGISTHFKFRKNKVTPFFYYSYIRQGKELNNYNLLAFGAISRINHLSIGTYITTSLENILDENNKLSHIAVTLGFIID